MNEAIDTLQLGHLVANLKNPEATLEDAMSEIDRELCVRVRIYGNWVRDRKLAASVAKQQLEALIAAYHFLCVLQESSQNAKALEAAPLASPIVTNLIPAKVTGLTEGKELL